MARVGEPAGSPGRGEAADGGADADVRAGVRAAEGAVVGDGDGTLDLSGAAGQDPGRADVTESNSRCR